MEEYSDIDSIKIERIDPELRAINGMNYMIFKGIINTNKKLFITLYPCSIISENVTIKDLLIKKI